MKFLILDGNSLLNRSFYAIKLLSNKNGQFTNAIYGFITTLEKIKQEVNPQYIAIAFDMHTPTFRKKIFDGYKANRKSMPKELASQIPILKELITYFGYKMVSQEGYEGDDILGTVAKYCESNNIECVIATGDYDILQLVSKNVSVRISTVKEKKQTSILYNLNKIKEEYNISPLELIEVKALQGDTSDNIPGVKGIGKKTALELIQKFSNIDFIYENIDNLDIKKGIKQKLIDGKDSAYLSRKLGTIFNEVPIEINLDDYIPKKINAEKLTNLLYELEFFSFIDKLGLKSERMFNITEQKQSIDVVEIADEGSFKKLEQNILLDKKLYFIANYSENKIVALNILFDNIVYYFDDNNNLFNEFLIKFLNNRDIYKVSYDFKKISLSLKNLGIDFDATGLDLLLANYVLDPSKSNYLLENIVKKYNPHIDNYMVQDNLNKIDNKQNIIYTYFLQKLYYMIYDELKNNNSLSLVTDIEQPFSNVLADMEYYGVKVDSDGISEYSKIITEKLERIKKNIFELSGCDFNINSPKQLGIVLFEKLMLPVSNKNKNKHSTSAEVLENLRPYHPIIDSILEYRLLAKLKSTYCDGILKLIQADGKIHSSFNQTETRTGRISSTEPNLQNIPIKNEEGRHLRKFFIPTSDFVFIDADYSQVELRVLAHIANDKNMIDAFVNDDDIHAITASQIFNVPINMVTSYMRDKAKTINFAIIYGMSGFSLSKELKISVKEANEYISRYFQHYSGVKTYMENIILNAKTNGYVETIYHRKRYLSELLSTNRNVIAYGERMARNMPIQGTAADIIKIAMINLYKKLKENNFKSRIILQVHDELIIESPYYELEDVIKLVKSEMENASKLSVPLKVNISSGRTWYDAKP